ncbi:hypothetical protein QE152_g19629 [Popillia japonica]|uniref:Uncharacterized protein n=1 Tax=Popillia japonica TaxID=7064 RepID=A0AAW1KPX1_POPJA
MTTRSQSQKIRLPENGDINLANRSYITLIRDNEQVEDGAEIDLIGDLRNKLADAEYVISELREEKIHMENELRRIEEKLIHMENELRRIEEKLTAKKDIIADLQNSMKRLVVNSRKVTVSNSMVQTSITGTRECATQTNTVVQPTRMNASNSAHVRKPNFRQQNQKPRILIISDSHGRNISNIMRKLDSENNYNITNIYKPNACLENVVEHIGPLTSNFTAYDYVVVFGGMNNALNGATIKPDKLLQLRELSLYTNVTLVSVPYCLSRVVLNRFIYGVNKEVYRDIVLGSNIVYIDSNRVLDARDLSKYGLHLTSAAKVKLFTFIFGAFNMDCT